MNFEGVIAQVFQPYFFFSIVFLIVSFVCVKIFIRFCPFVGERTKSLLYIIPLVVPLLIMAIFLPSTTFQMPTVDIKTDPVLGVIEHIGSPVMIAPDKISPINSTRVAVGPINSTGMLTSNHILPDESIISVAKPFYPPRISGGFSVTNAQVNSLSITGICCLIGLVVGAFFALTMIIADDRVAKRLLRVISLSANEQPWLQNMVAESSKKLVIACPKIGLVEDLRPNAFTMGYGRGATVVFSMGLLNLLNKEEVTAVALHELAHIKHNDFFFKTLTSALVAISFFNPVAFITASAAQRQREMFADEGAAALLEHTSALSSALTKIGNSLKTLPKAGLCDRSSVSLLFTSSVFFRSSILATHPRLTVRLSNISRQKSVSTRLSGRSIMRVVLLSVVLICFFIMASYAVAEVQHVGYVSSQSSMEHVGHTIEGIAVGDGALSVDHAVGFRGGMLVGVRNDEGHVFCQGGSHYFNGFFDESCTICPDV